MMLEYMEGLAKDRQAKVDERAQLQEFAMEIFRR
eukprot:COSAG02_NODE_2190_length_9560_cov_4.988166_11_plen_34_part_00